MSSVYEREVRRRNELAQKVYIGLARQGWERSGRTVSGSWECSYKDHLGRRCAVGHILDESDLEALAESGNLEHPLYDILDVPSIADKVGMFYEFWRKMQGIHDRDRTHPTMSMKEELEDFFRRHDIPIPKI